VQQLWDLTYFSRPNRSKWTKTFCENQGGTNRTRCTQRFVILYALAYPDRKPETSSPWPTLLAFRSHIIIDIIIILLLLIYYLYNLLTCGHQMWIVGVPDIGATKTLGLTYFSGSQGSKCTNQILGQTGLHKS